MPHYICLSCFHDWYSRHERQEMTCPQCHRRQGVDFLRFRTAVDSTKQALREVAASRPLPPPKPFAIMTAIADALGVISEALEREFSKPILPPNVVRKIYTMAMQELKEEGIEEGGPATDDP